MAGKQITGDGLPANIAGMSKNQLYDIMSQMKTLIEQNQQQARQILKQNPPLTKALFQAQIMLGMVQPPQVVADIQPPPSQHPQQSAQPPSQSQIQPAQSLPGQVDLQDPAGVSVSQIQLPIRKLQQNQPVTQIISATASSVNVPSQTTPSQPLQVPLQTKGHLNPPLSLPQSSQFGGAPTPPLHPASQPPALHQTQTPTASSQLQLPLQTTGISNLPLQPPLPPQLRQPSAAPFRHQYAQPMGPSKGFQHPGGPQHLSHPMYHSGNRLSAGIRASFPQGQPPHQSMYQSQAGGSHLVTEFGNQFGGFMQVDKGSPWISGKSDTPAIAQLPGSYPLVPGQVGLGNQPPRPASLTPEMEKALLQQVMSLTPEQINLLPPEQRNQVLQLQQILHQ
ncbi:hypothetical protein SLE2022_345330 [Rubroshorea leprosula]